VTHQPLILALGALAVVGVLAVLSAGRRRARKAKQAARETARAVSLFGRVLITAAVIAGGQYAVIRFAHTNLTLLVCVLAAPALLAATATVRALTITATTGRKGHHR
jgi:hypothetical protein